MTYIFNESKYGDLRYVIKPHCYTNMDGDHKTLTLVSGNKFLSGNEGDDGNDTKQHCKSLPLYYDRVSNVKLYFIEYYKRYGKIHGIPKNFIIHFSCCCLQNHLVIYNFLFFFVLAEMQSFSYENDKSLALIAIAIDKLWLCLSLYLLYLRHHHQTICCW